jgi:hypothetical protein
MTAVEQSPVVHVVRFRPSNRGPFRLYAPNCETCGVLGVPMAKEEAAEVRWAHLKDKAAEVES